MESAPTDAFCTIFVGLALKPPFVKEVAGET